MKEEECKPCKVNIGAAMLLSMCKEMKEKDGIQLELDCKLMEKELVEKEEAVAPEIVEKVHEEIMKKGSDNDREIAHEIYQLAKGEIK